jgi:hypothetical protein
MPTLVYRFPRLSRPNTEARNAGADAYTALADVQTNAGEEFHGTVETNHRLSIGGFHCRR